MATARFRTKWMVLLISIFLLSACGGDDSTTSNNGTSEGSTGTPFDLTSFLNAISPHSGTVGNKAAGKSYYHATGLAAGTYTITLYGLSADADLLVYNDLPFDYVTGPVCASRNGGTANEQCVVTVTTNGSTMNIEVDGQYSLSGATYLISVNYPVAAAACSSGICFNFDGLIDGDTTAWYSSTGFAPSGTGTPWNIDCNNNATGGTLTVCSIHSGVLSDSQTSCVSYTPTTATTYVSFNRMTDSTLYYDQLLFYIDNVLQLPVWSGTVAWQNVMFNAASGTHTYQWCHSNSNTNAGLPTSGNVWVDDIYIQ